MNASLTVNTGLLSHLFIQRCQSQLSCRAGRQADSFTASLQISAECFCVQSTIKRGRGRASHEGKQQDRPKATATIPELSTYKQPGQASAADESLLCIVTFAHLSKSALSPVRSARCSRSCDDCVFTECNFMRICFADAERILYTLEGSE